MLKPQFCKIYKFCQFCLRNNAILYQINGSLSYSCGLINFWPIDNNLIDVVAGANMTQNGNANFAIDRFQNVASAISFNGGSYSVPPGIYFSGDFTVTLWGNVDINPLNIWPRILCFTNWIGNALGNYQDTVCLDFGQNQISYFYSIISPSVTQIGANQAFDRNTWNHFAFTINGNTGSIYVNGILVSSGNLNAPRGVVRTVNIFGTIVADLNIAGYYACYAKIDFVKFYKRSLSSAEIQTESKQIFQKISN